MKAKNIYIALTFLILATGCEDILTEEPITFLAPENLTSVEGAEAAVKAAYDPLQESNYYKGQWIMAQNFQTDYQISRGSRYPHSIYNIDTKNINRMASSWVMMYQAIGRANLIISSFPELDFDDNLKGQWIAEAKVLRAFNYFNLVRGWGDVPLRIEPLEDLNNTAIPKTAESEVYDQIIYDLTEAINSGSLPESYPAAQLGRASVHAARVLLAHVYLTIENWTEAANMAQQVINSELQLEPDMYKMFSPEDITHSGYIWSIKYARIDGLGNSFLNLLHGRGTGYSYKTWFTHIGIPQHPIIANWDNNDGRKQLNLYDTDPNTPEGASLSAAVPMLFKKYIDTETVGQHGHGNDFPLYRYADALLIFAEADCQAKNGPGAEAYEAVNKVRRRAYGVDINTANPEVDLAGLSKDDFISTIWRERAHEFMLEGKRWFDLKRMGYEIATQKIQSSGDSRKIEFWGLEDWLFPIPQQEIDNNDALTVADQNPGY